MRALLLLVAAAALPLGACSKNDHTDANQAGDASLTAESIVSNDVTAIDAVTGDAANMAADVNYTEFENSVDNGAGSETSGRPKRPITKPATASPAPAENVVTATPANTTE